MYIHSNLMGQSMAKSEYFYFTFHGASNNGSNYRDHKVGHTNRGSCEILATGIATHFTGKTFIFTLYTTIIESVFQQRMVAIYLYGKVCTIR